MVLSVPCGNEERMSKWPGLKPRKFTFKGMKVRISITDVVDFDTPAIPHPHELDNMAIRERKENILFSPLD